MKTNSNVFFKALYAFVIIFALTFSNNTYASSGNSKSNHSFKKHTTKKHKKIKKFHPKKHKPNDKPDSIPLDGGLSVLLLGAAAFGVKKLRENKNDKV